MRVKAAPTRGPFTLLFEGMAPVQEAPPPLPPPVDDAVPDGATGGGQRSVAHLVRCSSLAPRARRAPCHGGSSCETAAHACLGAVRARSFRLRFHAARAIPLWALKRAPPKTRRWAPDALLRRLQPEGLYECPMCNDWTSRSLNRLNAHVSLCTGVPRAVVHKPEPPADDVQKRAKRLPWSAGPNVAVYPISWWAPATSELGDGHEQQCGRCLDGKSVPECHCATCPAAFHFVCLHSNKIGEPPPGALAHGWRCMTCEVRDARGLLVCNFCKRKGTSKSANRLLLVMHAAEDAEPRVIAVHKFCADLNSGHGGKPYNPEPIWREYQRARQLKCALCGESGASAGCELDECPKSYHAQCALEHPEKVVFCSSMTLACVQHRARCGIPEGGPLVLPPPAPRPPIAASMARPAAGGRPAKRARSRSAESDAAGEGAAADASDVEGSLM